MMQIPGYKQVQDSRFILRLEGDGNYTRLYLANKTKPLIISQNLRYFEVLLPRFLRIHKSALVNPDYVREVVDKGCKQMKLVLMDGTLVAVARRRIIQTKASLLNCLYDAKTSIRVGENPANFAESTPSRRRQYSEEIPR